MEQEGEKGKDGKKYEMAYKTYAITVWLLYSFIHLIHNKRDLIYRFWGFCYSSNCCGFFLT